MDEWNSQLRRGVLQLGILALIEAEQRYGYDIVTLLEKTPQLAAGEGTIYPLLRRLKKDGWVDTFWRESAAGPPRQYYRLTEEGRVVLSSMRSEWTQLVAAVNGLIGGGSADHV